MSMHENISVKLVGPRQFPRYVLVADGEYYRGPDEGWGAFHEALWYVSLRRATSQSQFLIALAEFDEERRASEWRRMNGLDGEEEESEDDD